MAVFATTTDYQTYVGEPWPAGKTFATYQREAANMVLDATKNDVFATDTDGVATQAQTKAAINDAVIIQIRAWIRADVDPEDSESTLDPAVVSSTVRGASYTLEAAGAQRAAKLQLLSYLTPKARKRLRRAGLASAVIGV